MENKRNYLVNAITKEYLKLSVSPKNERLNEKILTQKNEMIKKYGQGIKSDIDELYENIYSAVLCEVEEIIDYTLNYCFDIENYIKHS